VDALIEEIQPIQKTAINEIEALFGCTLNSHALKDIITVETLTSALNIIEKHFPEGGEKNTKNRTEFNNDTKRIKKTL
jgi:hypothetical protein